MKELIEKKYTWIIFIIVTAFFYSGTYYYFSNIYQPEEMLGKDIRLFRNTPAWKLAKAVDKEDIEKINHLVKDKGVPIDFQEPRFGQSLLIWATSRGKEKSVEALLKLGADPNLRDHYDGVNALIIASGLSYYTKTKDRCESNILRMLLQYGGDPNAVSSLKYNENGRRYGYETPLTEASGFCLEKVKLLVEVGADIDYVSEDGLGNPLEQSLSWRQPSIVKYLLIEKKANYRNAEKWITSQGDTITVLKRLRNWTFPLDSEDYKIKMEIVEYMKEQGEDYWSCPIPKDIRKRRPQEYLDQY